MPHDLDLPRSLNNKINHVNEQVLRGVFQDKNSGLETLLKGDKYVSIHKKNLQYLATELFVAKNDLSQKIMKQIIVFYENATYNVSSGIN